MGGGLADWEMMGEAKVIPPYSSLSCIRGASLGVVGAPAAAVRPALSVSIRDAISHQAATAPGFRHHHLLPWCPLSQGGSGFPRLLTSELSLMPLPALPTPL